MGSHTCYEGQARLISQKPVSPKLPHLTHCNQRWMPKDFPSNRTQCNTYFFDASYVKRETFQDRYLRDLWLQHLDRRGCGIRHVSQFSLTLKEVNTTVLHYKNWIQKQTYAGSNDFFLLLSWWYPTTQILL